MDAAHKVPEKYANTKVPNSGPVQSSFNAFRLSFSLAKTATQVIIKKKKLNASMPLMKSFILAIRSPKVKT